MRWFGLTDKMEEESRKGAWRNKVFKSKLLGMSARRRLYEGRMVPTALYEAETWNMEVVERKRWTGKELSVEEHKWMEWKVTYTGNIYSLH